MTCQTCGHRMRYLTDSILSRAGYWCVTCERFKASNATNTTVPPDAHLIADPEWKRHYEAAFRLIGEDCDHAYLLARYGKKDG